MRPCHWLTGAWWTGPAPAPSLPLSPFLAFGVPCGGRRSTVRCPPEPFELCEVSPEILRFFMPLSRHSVWLLLKSDTERYQMWKEDDVRRSFTQTAPSSAQIPLVASCSSLPPRLSPFSCCYKKDTSLQAEVEGAVVLSWSWDPLRCQTPSWCHLAT